MGVNEIVARTVIAEHFHNHKGDVWPMPSSAQSSVTMSREQNVAGLSSALTLANELRGDLIAHFANATRHITGLQSSATIPAAATNLVSLFALCGAMFTAYAAHNTDAVKASAWLYHNAQGTAEALTSSATPTTLQGAVTQLNDLQTKYNTHEGLTTPHNSVGTVSAQHSSSAAAAYGAVNLVPDPNVLAGDIVYWSILNGGTGAVTGVSAATVGGPGVAGGINFTFSADPQNNAIISYLAIRTK